jgi:hypothetical protein
MVMDMDKTPKVVPITENQKRIIAEDEGARATRLILGIGKRRIAFDFTSRVTELPPGTGDQPARVLPLKKKQQEHRD